MKPVPFETPTLLPEKPTPPRRVNRRGLVIHETPALDGSMTVSSAVELAKKALEGGEELTIEMAFEWIDFIGAVAAYTSAAEEA